MLDTQAHPANAGHLQIRQLPTERIRRAWPTCVRRVTESTHQLVKDMVTRSTIQALFVGRGLCNMQRASIPIAAEYQFVPRNCREPHSGKSAGILTPKTTTSSADDASQETWGMVVRFPHLASPIITASKFVCETKSRCNEDYATSRTSAASAKDLNCATGSSGKSCPAG